MFIWNWISFLVDNAFQFLEFVASRMVIGMTWLFVQFLHVLFSAYAVSSTPAKIVWVVVIGLIILMAIAALFKFGGQLAFIVVILLPAVVFFTKFIVLGALIVALFVASTYLYFFVKKHMIHFRQRKTRSIKSGG